ncbi:MAG: hypothetical protein U5K36_08925 [Roseovarius sp.]|nr:hypothetical protein [Roseovarius sp.]
MVDLSIDKKITEMENLRYLLAEAGRAAVSIYLEFICRYEISRILFAVINRQPWMIS